MSTLRLWAADPHQFGPGKIHAVDDERPTMTYCGKVISAFPGKPISIGRVTCKICGDAPQRRAESLARSEEWRRQYEVQEQERERQRAEELRQRRERYRAYLKTPKWAAIRAAVLRRAGNVCEGCAMRPAVQAHHLTYEHIGDEFLWELRAVCRECHERFHADKDQER